MNEFSQILSMVSQELKAGESDLEVRKSFPESLKKVPQRKALAVVAIQKVNCSSVGMQSLYQEEKLPFGKRAQVFIKISLCCKSGEECWKLWERCAQKLLFSKRLSAKQIECGEAAWQKDWGGIVLPVRLCCEFIIGQEEGDGQEGICPEQFEIIRKGAI